MNPLEWLQDNILYTDQKKKEINNAMYQNAPKPNPASTGNPGVGVGPFVSPKQKEYINNQMFKNAPPVKPEQTQAEKTAAHNKAASDAWNYLSTERGTPVPGPGGGNGFGLGSKNTVNTPGREEVVSPTNNQPNNAAAINARLDQQKNERKAALDVTKGGYDHSSGAFTGNDVALVPDSTLKSDGGGGNGGAGGNRDNTRVVPGSGGGMVQKGTDMSRSFNDLLATTNTSGYQPYSSNQLPTTGANPYEGTLAKTDAFNPAAPGVTGQSYDNYGAAGGAAAVQPGANSESAAFNPNATRIEGGSDRKKGGSLSDALNDTAGINSYMGKFSSGDQERAANRAFLDTKGSMEGLRAKEAVNGVVYAGGQHYVAGKSGDDKAVAINRSAARDISNGDETSAGASQKAQDFLAKKAADTVAAIKQAPTVLEQGAKDGAFQQDKPMFTGSTPAIGGAVEFDNNNDKTLPTFGNNGGYKSGFKKIDTSMPNPFGG